LERLGWLRCLMRAGEISDAFVELFRTLPNYPDFGQVMNDLYGIALQDVARPPEQWRDRLSPETLRVAALARALSGNPEEAVKLAGQAQELYAKAGARLFAAESATIHEEVRYRAAVDPMGDADGNLQRLARADALLGGTPDPSRPLTGPFGETRLIVLVAGGREADARLQIRRLIGQDLDAENGRLAKANMDVATRCLGSARRAGQALAFARKAAESARNVTGAQAILLHALLAAGQDAEAQTAAVQFLESAGNRKDAVDFLSRLETKYPNSAIWVELRMIRPELRKLSTTQPSTSPGE